MPELNSDSDRRSGVFALSLTAKTVGLSVLASAAGIVLLAGLATVTATDHVRDQVAETMEAAMAPRIEALNALGAAIEADLASVAETALVSEGLTRMSAAFAETVAADGSATALRSAYVDNNPFPTGEKHRLDQAAEAGAYNWAHGDVHPAMRILIEARNYYDIFLIDNTGALVYSVFKEADFGTNVLNGPYRDSGLGRLTRTLLTGAPGEVVMEDFSPYAPSAGTPQAFAGRAITDAAGQRIGIVAFQIPKTQVEAAIRIGDEGGVILPFLVGADGLLRSDLTSTEANDIGKTAFDVSAPVPFGGHPRLREGVGVAGSPVLLETAAIDFLGMDWTLVASRDRDLALKHEYALKEQLLIMSLPALLIPALAALLIGRTTTRPIRRLAEVAGALARGEQAELPDRERQDEIGALARSMEPINEAAVSARRLNSALDAASSAMAVADAEFRIVYVNAALISIVRKTESYWQKKRPEFSADKLIGQSIDFFHNVPDRNRNMLSGMQSPHNARIKFGDFVADLAIAPVSDASGNRIGYVLQWDDCTALANAEEQLSSLLAAVGEGDFTKRVDIEIDDPFVRQVADGLNTVCADVAAFLNDVERSMGHLAEGNLCTQLEGQYGGLLGRIAERVDETVVSLVRLVSQVKTVTIDLSQQSGDISHGAGELASRVDSQVASIEETSAAMTEIAASVTENAKSASTADELSSKASVEAEKGREVVASTVQAMTMIRESASQISEITSVIDSIAFQTNLLALNAAVEAARAGDAGKGFAVVAAEVGTLAQRSSEAAKNIKELIERSASHVAEGNRLVEATDEALSSILASIRNAAGMIKEIADASKEQSIGLQEITQAVGEMDELTQQNAALADQSAGSAKTLTDRAERLSELVRVFRTGAEGEAAERPEMADAPAAADKSADLERFDSDGWTEKTNRVPLRRLSG